MARDRCPTDPSAGSCPVGRREPEPTPVGHPTHFVAARCPASALARLADRTRWTGWAYGLPRSSVLKRLPWCTSASGQRPVTDDRERSSARGRRTNLLDACFGKTEVVWSVTEPSQALKMKPAPRFPGVGSRRLGGGQCIAPLPWRNGDSFRTSPLRRRRRSRLNRRETA